MSDPNPSHASQRSRTRSAASPIPFIPGDEVATQAILRSVALGFAAGLRSMTPLALVATAAQGPNTRVAQAVALMGVFRHLRSRPAFIVLGLAAAGEYIGDQLPVIPARVKPGPLAARAVSGAICGAIASAASGGSSVQGAKRGAAAAVIGAWAGYLARTRLTHDTPIPSPVWGALGDVIAIGLGTLALLPSLAPALRSLRVQFSPTHVTDGTQQAGAEQAPGWAYTSRRGIGSGR